MSEPLPTPSRIIGALFKEEPNRIQIARGQRIVVRDAFGEDLDRVALGGPKRGEDFPVVWVCRPEEWDAAQVEGREPEGVPWPREDVRVAEPVIVADEDD